MKNNASTRLLLTSSVILALVGSGCVSTTLQLAPNHPARIDAASGRVDNEPAVILLPNAPLFPPAELTAASEEENREFEQRDNSQPDGTREAPFVGQGVIRAVQEGQLQIQHGMIPGFMMAMTMTFSVASEATSASFEVGDEIVFKLERLPEEGIQIFSIDLVTAEPDDASSSTEP